MSIDRAKLKSACLYLKIDPFDDEEYAFLEKYYSIISLVATALKTLEADQYTFGIYLPTLVGLELKLKGLLDDITLIECVPLIHALQRGFDLRFSQLMNPFDENGKSMPLHVAMLSNPTLKMNYLGVKTIPIRLLNRLKDMLLKAAKAITESENANRIVLDRDDDNTSTLDRAAAATRTLASPPGIVFFAH